MVAAFFLFAPAEVNAAVKNAQTTKIVVRPSDFDQAMSLIRARANWPKSFSPPHMDINDASLTFISRQPLLAKQPIPQDQQRTEEDDFFIVRTQFYFQSPTIEKRVLISQGRDEQARLRFRLRNEAGPFEQFLYTDLGFPVQVYNRSQDMIVYAQVPAPSGGVQLKEWVYARQPNCPEGSRYSWIMATEEFYRRLVLVPGKKGAVEMQRQVTVQGIDPLDYAKQRHAIESIHKVWRSGKFHIRGEDTLGEVPPVFYTTREGRRKPADFRLVGQSELAVEIHEPARNYPILIESE